MVRVVGVDVGGSGVRAAHVDDAGGVHGLIAVPLPDRSVVSVCAAIERAVRGLEPERVGVGVPGFLRDGAIQASPNFPEWRAVPLGALLEERLGLPVVVENDANSAALGAWWERGGDHDVVLLTLGTGVGGGVVSGGQLLRGLRGTASELGHLYVGGDAPCGCGGVGCLETWASTVGLVRLAAEAGHPVRSGRHVVEAADGGEPWGVAVLEAVNQHLGIGLASLANLYAPHEIVIVGGLAQDPTPWSAAVRIFQERVIPANLCPVVWLGRADTLAIAGAARLAAGRP